MKQWMLRLGALCLLATGAGCATTDVCPDTEEDAAADVDDDCVDAVAPVKAPAAAKADKDQYCVPTPGASCP